MPQMTFKTIKKSSAPDLVVSQILKQIDNNTFPPGSKLPSQRELATMLGVGRSSIREAVNALVVRGYLEPIQGRGTFIRKTLPDADTRLEDLATAFRASSIMELMEARVMLECKSAALAAERANAAQINRIRESLARISVADVDYEIFLKQDLQFHHALAEATHNVVINEMTKFVLDKLAIHHAQLHTDRLSLAYRQISVDTAREVLAAVEAGDQKRAAEWMERHLGAIREELDEIL